MKEKHGDEYDFDDDMDPAFLKWIAEHGRNYSELNEYKFRLEQFKAQDKKLEELHV